MFKKEITFKNLDNELVTSPFYFNVSKIELLDLDASVHGGFGAMLQKIVDADDKRAMIQAVERIVLLAYGVKSDDGIHFIKNDDLREEFKQSDAYSELVYEILSDDKAAQEFITGIMPADMVSKALAETSN